jgi:hypothetical protein
MVVVVVVRRVVGWMGEVVGGCGWRAKDASATRVLLLLTRVGDGTDVVHVALPFTFTVADGQGIRRRLWGAASLPFSLAHRLPRHTDAVRRYIAERVGPLS